MKTYTLKGHEAHSDICFGLSDLIPVRHQRKYSFKQLLGFIDLRDFRGSLNWDVSDYQALYRKPENRGSDFFTIRDTGLVVIPGNAIFPTLIKEHELHR